MACRAFVVVGQLAVSLSGGDYVTQQVPFTFLSELDPVVALLDGANASMLRLTLSQLTAIDIPNEVISPIPADEIPWTSVGWPRDCSASH
eukprot:scaffold1970_cov396-Prasinococcus_capsulatus_cf.AAC.1